MKTSIYFFAFQLLCVTYLSSEAVGQVTTRLVVNPQHPQASDENPGRDDQPFATISRAAELAQPGDTVLVYGGIYRERVAPARGGTADLPIVYVAAPGQKVVIKGSDIWSPDWQPRDGHLFSAKFDTTAFVTHIPESYGFDQKEIYFNPYKEELRREPYDRQLSLGQLFIDGQPLQEVDDDDLLARLPGSWMLNDEKNGIRVHFPLSQTPKAFELIELTTRSRVFAPFRRGLGYIHVIGFEMEHGATNFPSGFWAESGVPQAGIVSTRGGHHWKIENCSIRYGKSLGLDIGSEGHHDADDLGQPEPEGSGYHIIRNNVISDNGCGGIAGYYSTASDISFNQIERNNRLGFTAPEVGGIKLHFFVDGKLEGNLVRDNYCYGIWLDNEWHNSRVTRNVLVGNEKAGIFMELGYGPVMIDHNIIALTRAYSGFGLYSHDASGVTFAHNLLYFNAGFGVWSHVATDRTKNLPGDDSEEKVQIEASHWKVVNNIFIGNGGAVSFPLESDISENNFSDYNLVAGGYERLTYETFAEVLDDPLFMLNINKGRSSREAMFSSLEASLRGQSSAEVKKEYREQKESLPFLSLEEWQKLTNNDQHSQNPQLLRPYFNPVNLQLSFFIGEAAKQTNAPKMPELKYDFFGHVLGENPLPGPFQDMKVEGKLNDRSNMLEYRGPYNDIRSHNAMLNFWTVHPFSLQRSIPQSE